MCHNFGGTVQAGIPLNITSYRCMGEEERVFWCDFFQEAKNLMAILKMKGESEPLTPSSSLKEKYKTAIERYRGQNIRQVLCLETIFSF